MADKNDAFGAVITSNFWFKSGPGFQAGCRANPNVSLISVILLYIFITTVVIGAFLFSFSELEVHDIVNVKISSRADKWALHVLNLLTSVRGFLAGVHLAREVPIFGDPFGTGDLFFGIIDELRFDAEKYSLDLVELKTRKTKRMPGKAQKKQHFLQVDATQTGVN